MPYLTGDEWTDCFHIEGISLPMSPYLGVSALTGEVFDAHEYVRFSPSEPPTHTPPPLAA